MVDQTPNPEIAADRQAHEASCYRAILHEMIDIGAGLARMIAQAATPETAASLAIPFERVTRSIRRSIMLAQKLDARVTASAPQRQAAIRDIEDGIESGVADEPKEHLDAERPDRMDSPDRLENIDHRPIADVIREICRDLGHDPVLDSHPWTARQTADIAVLRARVAQIAHPPPPPWTGAFTAPPQTNPQLWDP